MQKEKGLGRTLGVWIFRAFALCLGKFVPYIFCTVLKNLESSCMYKFGQPWCLCSLVQLFSLFCVGRMATVARIENRHWVSLEKYALCVKLFCDFLFWLNSLCSFNQTQMSVFTLHNVSFCCWKIVPVMQAQNASLIPFSKQRHGGLRHHRKLRFCQGVGVSHPSEICQINGTLLSFSASLVRCIFGEGMQLSSAKSPLTLPAFWT